MPDIIQTTSSQPRNLYVLTFGEACERFNYYGTQMLLVLYLINVFHFTDNQSYSLYGAYAAFAFALPVVGGILADRLLGQHLAIVIGSLLLIVGNLFLILPSFPIFCLGLAITLIGIGLYKANSTTLVGLLYSEKDTRREAGYTLFYMGMNIGGTLGPISYGLIIHTFGWHTGFIFSAILLAISLSVFLYKNAFHFSTKTTGTTAIKLVSPIQLIQIAIGIILASIAISLLLFHSNLLKNFITIFAAITLTYLIYTACQQTKSYRNHIIALLIMFIFIMCFFAASLQVGSSINLFIERNINRTLFGWQIPTLFFTSLYPFFVIIMAPFISRLWDKLARQQKEPNVINKLLLGLLLAVAGFICFTLAAIMNEANTLSYFPLFWIIAGNACLGVGELCIAPAIFSSISRLAPTNLRSTLMGSVFLFIAFGSYLSSILAKSSSYTANTINLTLTAVIYKHAFLQIALLTIIVTGILLLVRPLIKSLMATKN